MTEKLYIRVIAGLQDTEPAFSNFFTLWIRTISFILNYTTIAMKNVLLFANFGPFPFVCEESQ